MTNTKLTNIKTKAALAKLCSIDYNFSCLINSNSNMASFYNTFTIVKHNKETRNINAPFPILYDIQKKLLNIFEIE